MNKNIEGKIIVVTGPSSGLGEATARHLSELGAVLVLGARCSVLGARCPASRPDRCTCRGTDRQGPAGIVYAD